MNMGQDRHMQMVGGNGGNQFRHYAGQNEMNQNGYNAGQDAGIQMGHNARILVGYNAGRITGSQIRQNPVQNQDKVLQLLRGGPLC
ncbi:hypothetical protein Tco_1547799 [Tanacetum coccineum]